VKRSIVVVLEENLQLRVSMMKPQSVKHLKNWPPYLQDILALCLWFFPPFLKGHCDAFFSIQAHELAPALPKN